MPRSTAWFILLLMTACGRHQTLFDRSAPEDLPPQLRELAIAAAAYGDPSYVRTYTFTDGNQPVRTEVTWLRLDPGQRIRQREVYHVFDSRALDTREYYVTEMRLDLQDTVSRQLFLDFRIVADRDTARVVIADRQEVRVNRIDTLVVGGESEVVARLLGYAHEGDDRPGHHKYWSPRYGTLLVWYGNGTRLTLTDAPPAQRDQALALVAAVSATLDTTLTDP
ncbi:MAG: hypothetical protein SF053_12615 [Bacteroidia bacterium]|nr:hypothetical protein [Bacteroidia bacterium]